MQRCKCSIISIRIWKFKSLYLFGGDSTLVPQIAKDCDQFAWGKIRLIFTNFHEVHLYYLQLYRTSKQCSHSLLFTLASPHTTKAKKPIQLFSLVKNFIYDLWLVRCSCLTCEETIQPIRICEEYCKSYIFIKFSLE